MSDKLTSKGQPSAPKSAPKSTPGAQKPGQGVIIQEMENLEKYVPPGFEQLHQLLMELLDEIGEDQRKYNAAITTLAQRYVGLDDVVQEITIKGIDLHNQKYKIVIRER